MNADKESVVLVTIDSLRKDHCGFMRYERDTMPFLSDLASDAFIAEHGYSNGTASAQAFRSILTSTYPLDYRDYDELTPNRPYIADLLSDVGVQTYAFVSENPYISRYFGFDRGFDYFNDFLPEKSNESDQSKSLTELIEQRTPKLYQVLKRAYWLPRIRAATLTAQGWSPPYNPAKDVVDEVLDTVEPHNEGTFVWIQLMDVHLPHFPYHDYKGVFCNPSSTLETYSTFKSAVEEDHSTLIDCYDESIRYVDSQLRRLKSGLESIFGDLHFIITNDHGELFGEYIDEVGHPHEHIYPEQVEAPLLIDSPKADEMKHNESSLVAHLDIVPTILDLFEVDKPAKLKGDSLLNNFSRDYIVSETCPYDQEAYNLDYAQHKIALITDEEFFVHVYDEDADSLSNYPGSRDHVYSDKTSKPSEKSESIVREHRSETHSPTTMDDILERVAQE